MRPRFDKGKNNVFWTPLSLQVEKARNDELKHWENDPKATFALILLQDQFMRSIYKVCTSYTRAGATPQN